MAIKRERIYSVKVRQVTATYDRTADVNAAAGAPAHTIGRRVLGTFQVSLSVKTRDQALLATERLYAVLLWIQEAIAPTDRWYPVFLRYLSQLAGVIAGLGGNPGQIVPSPSGQVPRLPRPKPPPVKGDEAEAVVGKIEGVIYDHFGDFEGFVLETETGRHHRFYSREAPMLVLIRRAWIERTRVTVLHERHRSDVPRSVILEAGGAKWAADPD